MLAAVDSWWWSAYLWDRGRQVGSGRRDSMVVGRECSGDDPTWRELVESLVC